MENFSRKNVKLEHQCMEGVLPKGIAGFTCRLDSLFLLCYIIFTLKLSGTNGRNSSNIVKYNVITMCGILPEDARVIINLFDAYRRLSVGIFI